MQITGTSSTGSLTFQPSSHLPKITRQSRVSASSELDSVLRGRGSSRSAVWARDHARGNENSHEFCYDKFAAASSLFHRLNKKFIYVSVFKANENAGIAYFGAHAAFEYELKNSGLDYAIIRPTGIFYIFAEFVKLARKGIIPLFGDGSAEMNPIHESEVAATCLKAITSHETEFDVGGPEVFTRRRLGELCFEALNKKPRFISYPVGLFRFLIKPIAYFDRRLFEFLDFGIFVNTNDCVAPKIGEKKLESYLRQLTTEGEVRTM